jgi:hypothetical protein
MQDAMTRGGDSFALSAKAFVFYDHQGYHF